MRTSFISAIAATALVLAACGGGPGGDAGKAADNIVSFAQDQDLELDKGCVDELAEGFSADDAKALADAGSNPEAAEISEEGDDIAESMFRCIDPDSLIDSIVTEFDDDETIDGDCVREELDGKSTEEIQDSMFDAALACST